MRATFITGTLKPEIEILFCNQERSECEKCVNYNSLSHGIEASVTWIEGRFADVKASFKDFERADVVEASFEDFKRNWISCGLFFKVSYIMLNTDYCYGRLNLLVNHFHFLKEPFDLFRFTITELKYRTLSVRKTWRSFPSLLLQMSHLSQSAKGKMIFWRLHPVWSPGCLSPQVESNDGTVLPELDPVWSQQIRSAKIIQPNAEPRVELSRLTK